MTNYTDIINKIITLNKEGFKLADDEAKSRILAAINELWAIIKKDSLASSRIGRPAPYTREAIQAKLEDFLATARSDWAKEVQGKLIQAIDQIEIVDGERLHILGAELTKFKIKEILKDYHE